MAIVGVDGLSVLPENCLALCGGFAGITICINLLRDFLPSKWARFVPLPMCMALVSSSPADRRPGRASTGRLSAERLEHSLAVAEGHAAAKHVHSKPGCSRSSPSSAPCRFPLCLRARARAGSLTPHASPRGPRARAHAAPVLARCHATLQPEPLAGCAHMPQAGFPVTAWRGCVHLDAQLLPLVAFQPPLQPFYLGAWLAVDMCVGAIIMLVWRWVDAAECQLLSAAAASGEPPAGQRTRNVAH